MLTAAQCDRLDVILVSPRNPLNIGAVARAMANFGFSHLIVAAPYAPHWREARSAIGAPELLERAKETNSLADAVSQCTFVVGTGTLTYRKPEQPVISLPSLGSILEQELAGDGRIALVFGPEKHGLTRDDLSRCHVLVEIPTDANQPSMNLGQAVAVCLYELASRSPSAEKTTPRAPSRASSKSLDRLTDFIEQTMTAAGYSRPAIQAANSHDLRLMLRRLALSGPDLRRILGLFRRILWRLQATHRPQSKP